MKAPAVAAAKQFFLTTLEDQALQDGVPLSEIERKMFLSSALSPSDQPAEFVQQFEAACDSDAYEAKIAELLRNAYRRDRTIPSRAAQWMESLRALKGEDFYGMVMLEQAGLRLPRPAPGLVRDMLEVLPQVAVFLVFAAPAVLLCLDPFQWRVVQADWFRFVLFLVFAAGLWITTITIPDKRKRERLRSHGRTE